VVPYGLGLLVMEFTPYSTKMLSLAAIFVLVLTCTKSDVDLEPATDPAGKLTTLTLPGSGADSIGHGGTCLFPTFTNGWTRGGHRE